MTAPVIIVERNELKFTNKPKIRSIGKAGRQERQRAQKQREKSLWENCVKKETRPERAVKMAEFSMRDRPLFDITNHHYIKGKPAGTNTVRAKQKRQLSVKEPRICGW